MIESKDQDMKPYWPGIKPIHPKILLACPVYLLRALVKLCESSSVQSSQWRCSIKTEMVTSVHLTCGNTVMLLGKLLSSWCSLTATRKRPNSCWTCMTSWPVLPPSVKTTILMTTNILILILSNCFSQNRILYMYIFLSHACPL